MCWVQTHADYEQRLQEEVNARLLKEQELQHLVHYLIPWSAMLEPSHTVYLPCSCNLQVRALLMTESLTSYSQADLLRKLLDRRTYTAVLNHPLMLCRPDWFCILKMLFEYHSDHSKWACRVGWSWS